MREHATLRAHEVHGARMSTPTPLPDSHTVEPADDLLLAQREARVATAQADMYRRLMDAAVAQAAHSRAERDELAAALEEATQALAEMQAGGDA